MLLNIVPIMLIKFENILLSFGLVLMLSQLLVSAAVVKPLNKKVNNSQVLDQKALANEQDDLFVPFVGASNDDQSYSGPYFPSAPNYPPSYGDDADEQDDNENQPPLRKGRKHKANNPLPMDEPEYYYYPENSGQSNDNNNQQDNQDNQDNSGQYQNQDYDDGGDSGHGGHDGGQEGGHRQQNKQRGKKPKIYKAIERVYFYPETGDSEIQKNKNALQQMQDFIPDEPETFDDTNDPLDDPQSSEIQKRKDFNQMRDNPPRAEHEEEPEEGDVYSSDGVGGTQQSIAKDVNDFGREAEDETQKFESFLDNLKKFAENSEKEYSSPYRNKNSEDGSAVQESDDLSINDNPNYMDSMAAHAADDRTRDYETVSNYGKPDAYDSEKHSYQNQNGGEQRAGHRYHKDRRRPKKSSSMIPEEMFEQRDKEVTGLIDSEPDEGDYLSNVDVVKQMKNSERKYNTGVDPVYSSQRDFDEVHRLEKMIENVALLNKQKEKQASNTHDRNENTDGVAESSNQETQLRSEDKTS